MLKEVFLILKKFDEFKGIATGVISCQEPDHDGEMFDYNNSKPYFKKWSASQFAASKGQSMGNVRLQHDAKRPVGRLLSLDFDDANKVVRASAEIVDPIAKQMLASGVLTGFSIGGDYVSKTPMAGGLTSYIASPVEVSVVDRPCSPSATFESVKADGSTQLMKFYQRGGELDIEVRVQTMSKAGMSNSLICSTLGVTAGTVYKALRSCTGASMIERRRRLIEEGIAR